MYYNFGVGILVYCIVG